MSNLDPKLAEWRRLDPWEYSILRSFTFAQGRDLIMPSREKLEHQATVVFGRSNGPNTDCLQIELLGV